MHIIAVDDEKIALHVLATAITEAVPEATIHRFASVEDDLAFCGDNSCEIAFLDIDMGDMNGIALAKKLKRIHPTVNIVFVTAYIQYAAEAVFLYISGYIMKPATKEKIVQEMEHLRHPVPVEDRRKLWVQCFGNFEVFARGEPVTFRYSKTKELLAYLIDRGGAYCSNGELIAVLCGCLLRKRCRVGTGKRHCHRLRQWQLWPHRRHHPRAACSNFLSFCQV